MSSFILNTIIIIIITTIITIIIILIIIITFIIFISIITYHYLYHHHHYYHDHHHYHFHHQTYLPSAVCCEHDLILRGKVRSLKHLIVAFITHNTSQRRIFITKVRTLKQLSEAMRSLFEVTDGLQDYKVLCYTIVCYAIL